MTLVDRARSKSRRCSAQGRRRRQAQPPQATTLDRMIADAEACAAPTKGGGADDGTARQRRTSTRCSDAASSMVARIAQVPRDDGVEDGIPPDGVVPAEIVRVPGPAAAARRRAVRLPGARRRPAAAGVDPVLLPRSQLAPTRSCRARSASARSTPPTGRSSPQLYPVVRDEVDEAERLVRMKDSDAPAVDAAGRPIGAAARSPASCCARGWSPAGPDCTCAPTPPTPGPDDKTIPEMDTSPDRVRLLRMERLAPAVLLVLFDGVPAVVHIEEPRRDPVRRAARPDGQPRLSRPRCVTVRDVAHPNNGPLQSGGQDLTVPVPFRPGAPGVINMKKLHDALVAVPGTNMGPTVDSARIRDADAALPAAAGVRRHHRRAALGRVRRDGQDRRRWRNGSRSRARCSRSDQFSPDQIRQAALTPRWAALSQTAAWPQTLRTSTRSDSEPRLLVPIDVQALVVRAGVNDSVGMLRLPFRDGQTDLPPLDVTDPGTPRPPGVHLLWSVPPALGRGTIVPTRPRPTTPPGGGCNYRYCRTAGRSYVSPCPRARLIRRSPVG